MRRHCSGLPDDPCPCPHWGYVLRGRLTYRFPDREEVFEAGDAFYLPPGHIPMPTAGHRVRAVQPDGGARDPGGHASNMEAMQRAESRRAHGAASAGRELLLGEESVLHREQARRRPRATRPIFA